MLWLCVVCSVVVCATATQPFRMSFDEYRTDNLGPWYNVFVQQQDHFDLKFV
jgi:hypothetical protein